MADLKKRLKPHAVTCIKRSIVECLHQAPSCGLAYGVFCDRADCWSCDELIADYVCAVNVRERGDLVGDFFANNCQSKNLLSIEIEVYCIGCDDECGTPGDTALSVLAEIGAQLHRCINCNDSTIKASEVEYRGYERRLAPENSQCLAVVTAVFDFTHTFDHEDPCLVIHSGAEPAPKKLWFE